MNGDSESYQKRLNFHDQIRTREIERTFQQARKKRLNFLEGSRPHTNFSPNPNTTPSRVSASSLRKYEYHKRHIPILQNNKLSFEDIEQLWDILIDSSAEQLSEPAVIKLIERCDEQVKLFDYLINKLKEEEDVQDNQERIVHAIFSEVEKSEQTIKLLLQIIYNQSNKNNKFSTRATSLGANLAIDYLRTRQNPIKYYQFKLVKFFMVLLGNLCISNTHTAIITKIIPLSQLIELVQPYTRHKNRQQIPFMLVNFIYHLSSQQKDNYSDYQLELQKIYQYLLEKTHKQLKDRADDQDKPQTHSQLLSGSKRKKSRVKDPEQKLHSDYYLNDLLQCIVKIRTLQLQLSPINHKQKQRIVEIKNEIGQKMLEELNEITKKFNQELIEDTEIDCMKILLSFIRDIWRVESQQKKDKSNSRQPFKENFIMAFFHHCQQIFTCLHNILLSPHEYPNQSYQQCIVISWELISHILILLKETVYCASISDQKNYSWLFHSEIKWLNLKIIKAKPKNSHCARQNQNSEMKRNNKKTILPWQVPKALSIYLLYMLEVQDNCQELLKFFIAKVQEFSESGEHMVEVAKFLEGLEILIRKQLKEAESQQQAEIKKILKEEISQTLTKLQQKYSIYDESGGKYIIEMVQILENLLMEEQQNRIIQNIQNS